ncbi:hypothetical protein ACIPL1_22125 [Pseudomonas sp. NPDC090202]|uniref:hypothetical protein n=1 Tax=unclassified Pseudomonas TaxID=196821 RepID=UPI00381F5EF3
MAVLVETLDPLVKPVMAGRRARHWIQGQGIRARANTLPFQNNSQHSETPYRLSFAIDINFGPLAPSGQRLLSMKSGDFTC